MLCNIDLTDFAEFIVDIFGKKGPKVFDTTMAYHNHFLEEDLGYEEYQKLVEADKIVIGREGKNINKADLRIFLEAFKARQNLKIFMNDRTYHFEGVITTEDKNYEVRWGSIDFSAPAPLILPCPICGPSSVASSPQKATVYLISGKKIVEAAKSGKYEDERQYPLYDIDDIERVYPGIKGMVKRGDIFEDVDESGYRLDGVFLYDGQKTINQGHEYDDYGYPPDELKLIIEFPPGYWDVNNLIINDTFEKPRRKGLESAGTVILSPSFYWHSESTPSFLYFDELGISRDITTSKVSFTYPRIYNDGTEEEVDFNLKYFILDYGSHRYLIDADIAKQAEKEKKRVKEVTGHYGYWACCHLNHTVEEDKMLLNRLREAIDDPTVDYVLRLDF